MTKARARERAKARAARKSKKKDDSSQPAGPKLRPGQFDPGSGSITGPKAGAESRRFAGARRGSARSR